MKIVVPSTGRADKSSTLSQLFTLDIEYSDTYIATPEVDAYSGAYPEAQILEVPYGIGRARQAILTHARENAWGPFWMIDDDITATYRREGGSRLVRQLIRDTIFEMHAFLGDPIDLALAGPNWRQRAWSAPAVEDDRHVGAIVRVNPEAPINYPESMGEDLAVVLQAITAGWHTKRLSLWAYTTPPPATVDGGCRDDYAAGRMEAGILELCEQYPDFLAPEVSMSTGTMRAKVDWQLLDKVTR